MQIRRLLVVLLAFAAVAVSSVHAHVKASLVSASATAQPGQALTVALRLEHEPHWHTYWINAGTGLPTSLDWTLPAGWKAGSIQWPVPIVIKDSHENIAGNGYENVVYLPVTLSVPADARPGEKVTLKADAEWLMCSDVCIPGKAKVALDITIAASAPGQSPAAAAIAQMRMPQPLGQTQVALSLAAKTLTLTVTGRTDLKDPHVFDEPGLIQYDEPQTATQSGNVLTLVLPLSPSADASIDRLTGVLAYTAADGTRQGLRLDQALKATPAPAQPAHPAAPTAPSIPSKASGAPAANSLLATLGLAFVGGLILNLMPCVFPVLGIKILGFVNQAGADRRKVTLHGLVFFLGVLLSFWSLAGVLAVLRAGGTQLGWGFQLQSAPFVFGLAIVMLVFALSMSGVFEFGLSATSVGGSLQSKQGYTGSFFTGILATVVATPCSAPFLAPALGAALALPLVESFAVFTAIAVGLGLPYLLLSIFPAAVKVLPRPGAWMETFKQLMAFPLYATVAYLSWVLAAQTNEYGLLYALFGLTLIALATWLYGRYHTLSAKPWQSRLGLYGGLAIALAGVALGYPEKVQTQPTAHDLVWNTWSPEAIAQATASGKTVYVDFTARWCFTCQTNKKIALGNAAVKQRLADKGVVLLRADWTNSDPKITAELARWGRSAVPFNLVYKPGQPAPTVLPELLTPDIVLKALQD